MKQLLALSKSRKQDNQQICVPVKKAKKAKSNFNAQPIHTQQQIFSISQSEQSSLKNSGRQSKIMYQKIVETPNKNNFNLQEVQDQPPQQQIQTYAQIIGIKLPQQQDLLYIAREGLMAELPDQWDFQENLNGQIIYVNKMTNEKSIEHPLDKDFRQKVINERKKKAQLKNAFVSKPNKKLPHQIIPQNKSQSKNLKLEQIIKKNTEKQMPKVNFLYGDSDDDDQWEPQQSVQPQSVFFSRNKNMKNSHDLQPKKTSMPKSLKSIKNIDTEQPIPKDRKQSTLSNKAPYNIHNIDHNEEVNADKYLKKINQKQYIDRIDQLFVKKNPQRLQNRKNQISNNLHNKFEQQLKIIDAQQLSSLHRLQQIEEYIKKVSLKQLIEKISDYQLDNEKYQKNHEQQIIQYLIRNSSLNLNNMENELQNRKKQIQRKVLKQHTDSLNTKKQQKRRQFQRRRQLKFNNEQIDGLYTQMTNCSKILQQNKQTNNLNYLKQFDTNLQKIHDIQIDKQLAQLQANIKDIASSIISKISTKDGEQNWKIRQQNYSLFMQKMQEMIQRFQRQYIDKNKHKKQRNLQYNQSISLERQIQKQRSQAQKIIQQLHQIKNGLNQLKKQQQLREDSSARDSGQMTDRQSKLVDLLQGFQSKPNSARSK